MSEHKQTENNPQGNDKKMVIAMGSIGLICALLIVLTYQGTFASIEKIKRKHWKKQFSKYCPEFPKLKRFS